MTKIIHVWNHPLKFVVHQVEREFFGFIGFIASVGILGYGVIFKDSKIQTSTFSATGFNEVIFSIPIWIIGILLIIIFGFYLLMKRK